MFILYADKTQLTVHQREPITSGSVDVYRVRFEFSDDWKGLIRTACFRSGTQTVCVLLDESGACTLPWEVTDPDDSGKHLFAGVYGSDASGVVLPTVWADCGVIAQGVCTGVQSRPPVPGLLEQALERKADGFEMEGRELRLMAGDKQLASVTLPAGGGAGSETATEEEVDQMLHEVFNGDEI